MNGSSNNGCIKVEGGVPEIHTVVLYKNPIIDASAQVEPTATSNTAVAAISDHPIEILVIDPSNFLFSSHLSNFNIQRDLGTEKLLKVTYDKMLKILPADQYLDMQKGYLSIVTSDMSGT